MGNLFIGFVNIENLAKSKAIIDMAKISWGGYNSLREKIIDKRE